MEVNLQSPATISVNRTSSSVLSSARRSTVSGSVDPRGLLPDSLDLRILVDHSIVEIFAAQSTFALTTRVYPALPDSNGVSIRTSPDQAGGLVFTAGVAFVVQ